MQLKSNLKHVFTSFSTKPPNNYRIFCGNKQIQSKYIYRFYDIIISPSHHPQPSQKHRHPCAQSNPPKTSLSLEKRYHSCHMNALLVSHPCETPGVQLRASMPLYERSVGFASLRNSGRSTSGIHARPLSKVRCCRPKKFGRLPMGLPHHYPSLRTNPTNTALSLAMHYILGSLVKGSWIATRLLLIINCNILRFYQR